MHIHVYPDFETTPQDGLVTESEHIGYTILYHVIPFITCYNPRSKKHGESTYGYVWK